MTQFFPVLHPIAHEPQICCLQDSTSRGRNRPLCEIWEVTDSGFASDLMEGRKKMVMNQKNKDLTGKKNNYVMKILYRREGTRVGAFRDTLSFSTNMQNPVPRIVFSRIWSSTRSCGTGFITQPSWLLHFRPTKMVRRKFFVPLRYQPPRGISRGPTLNVYTSLLWWRSSLLRVYFHVNRFLLAYLSYLTRRSSRFFV